MGVGRGSLWLDSVWLLRVVGLLSRTEKPGPAGSGWSYDCQVHPKPVGAINRPLAPSYRQQGLCVCLWDHGGSVFS